MVPGDPLPRKVTFAGDLNWYQEAWQKKVQKFMAQVCVRTFIVSVWHQMLTHHNNHSILSPETVFFLIYLTGNSLQLSHLYECAPTGSMMSVCIITVFEPAPFATS
jgi:hypothetical protein